MIAMTRFIGCGNAKRVVQSLIQNRNSSSVEINKIRLYDRAGSYSFSRLFLYNKHTLNESAFQKPSNGLLRDRCFRIRSFHSFAETRWKRIFQMCSYGGSVLPPLSRIACAVSLALTRSNLVPRGIVAFVAGELALRRRTWAEPSSDSLCRGAQEGRVYFTSFLLSLLELFVLVIRAVHLAALFAPCLVSAPFVNSRHRKTWLRLVHRTLEKAGPAFIKWGQWAATRPDLFARDLCGELSKLHANAPAHSFSFTKKSVERAFGRKIHEIFETFEEEPVASGSVAQVHQATLKYRYPGQAIKPVVVAVKVRHPGVGEVIRRDFAIINFVAKISRLVPGLDWLRLDESVRQFAVFMMSQVDLSREAAHLNRFIYNFRSWKDVSFPKPLYPLVHPSVLVETYERGESVMHYVDEVKGHERIKTALAHIGSHALLKMLLVDNFIHADMHPGNILVRVTDKNPPRELLFKSKPHVIFLDVGMTAELSKRDRANLLEFFKAVAVKDGRTVAEQTLRLSTKQNCPNPKAFIQEMETSFRFWGSPEGESISTGDCIKQLLEQVRRHKVNIDGNVCTVMVTTLVLEGWQQKLDPEYDVMHTLRSLLFKADWAESFFYTIEGLMAP